tara:strand:+ start:703 stop:2265 length:1563 start_codon:yes stop_codon:yes gene_type:complete
MATNLLNCTVTTYSSLEDVGDIVSGNLLNLNPEGAIARQIISDPVIQAATVISSAYWPNSTPLNALPPSIYVLIIEADPGFTVSAQEITISGNSPVETISDANNLTTYSWSPLLTPGVDIGENVEAVILCDTTGPHALGNKIVATIVIDPNFVMPANDVTINIDFDGAAVLYEVPTPEPEAPEEPTGTLTITPIGRMLAFAFSDCVGYNEDDPTGYGATQAQGENFLSGLEAGQIGIAGYPCTQLSSFPNEGVFVTGIISDEFGNEYETHSSNTFLSPTGGGPDFLNENSDIAIPLPENTYGPTNFIIPGASSDSIRFALNLGDGTVNGNIPESIYIKFVAFSFTGVTTGDYAAPPQPSPPFTPLYINPNNCQPVFQKNSAYSNIDNNIVDTGTYSPGSTTAPFVFAETPSATYNFDDVCYIQNYEVTEIFPEEGWGTETNAVLVRIDFNPNYTFNIVEGQNNNQSMGIALSGLTTENVAGETLTDPSAPYNNSYNYLSFDSFPLGNGVEFNINIIDGQG